MMKAAAVQTRRKESAQPLMIEVGRQGDGNTYSLDIESQARILEHYPGAPMARDLFIGTLAPIDPYKVQAPRWRDIGKLLTGLNEDQIEQLGGLVVYDPIQARPIWASRRA